MGRYLNGIHQPAVHTPGGHVLPVLASITGDMDQAVITADPQGVGIVRALGEGEDRVVLLDILVGVGACTLALLVILVARQVGTHFRPVEAAIAGFQQHVGSVVDHLRVVQRHVDGCVPVEAVLRFPSQLSKPHLRIGLDGARGAGFRIKLIDQSEIATGVGVAGIVRIHRHVSAFTAAMHIPVIPANLAIPGPTANRHRGVVLLTAVNSILETVVGVDPVELRRGLIVLTRPALATVEGDVRPAIVGVDHPPGVVRIHPEIVIVAVGHLDRGKSLAAINGLHEGRVQNIHRILVIGVCKNVHVIPGAGPKDALLVQMAPAITAIIRAVQATLITLGLDNGPDPPRLCRRCRNADLAHAARQVIAELLPGLAAIRRTPDATALTTGAQ